MGLASLCFRVIAVTTQTSRGVISMTRSSSTKGSFNECKQQKYFHENRQKSGAEFMTITMERNKYILIKGKRSESETERQTVDVISTSNYLLSCLHALIFCPFVIRLSDAYRCCKMKSFKRTHSASPFRATRKSAPKVR